MLISRLLSKHQFYTYTRAFSILSEGEIADLRRKNSKNLERLPIPSLSDTKTRYLESVRGFLDGSDYEAEVKSADFFDGPVAKEIWNEV